MNLLLDLLLDAFMDTVRMLPFLFAAYLLAEYLEQRPQGRLQQMLTTSPLAPAAGGLLGLLPQCGFSAAIANLFGRGMVSMGTLLAVFIATSDEALPILLAQPGSYPLLVRLMGAKLLLALVCGLLLDRLVRPASPLPCPCHCCPHDDHGAHLALWKPALRHTLSTGLFVFGVSLVLGGLLTLVGEERLAALLMTGSLWQPLLAAFVGFIPNCAASVVLTQLLLEGSLSFGSALAGLTTGAGAGLLVLWRVEPNKKRLFCFLGLLYAIGAGAGLLADLFF